MTTATEGTASERYLAWLAGGTFLSLWSYPHPFTDEGRKSGGDGKELCDLIAVFGRDVILFSDKHIVFTQAELTVAWHRWYRRAIESSARQLVGAEGWIRRFPEKVFVDHRCSQRLPVRLPAPNEMRTHKVIIANGAGSEMARRSGGRHESLHVLTGGALRSEFKAPFMAYSPIEGKGHFHIFDERAFDLVLRELDTAPDFIWYLTERARVGGIEGLTVIAGSEADLLAAYLNHGKARRYALPNGFDVVKIPPGLWGRLASSPQYSAREQENRVSYNWDRFIEHFAQFTRIENHPSPNDWTPPVGFDQYELALRIMASEPRLRRRQLARWMLEGAQIAADRERFARSVALINDGPARGFTILFAKRRPGDDYRTYRQNRAALLTAYVYQCKLKFPVIESVLGIVTEGYVDDRVAGTEDIMVLDCRDWTPEHQEHAQATVAAAELKESTQVNWAGSERNFPPG
jgi:hypothetical protein